MKPGLLLLCVAFCAVGASDFVLISGGEVRPGIRVDDFEMQA